MIILFFNLKRYYEMIHNYLPIIARFLMHTSLILQKIIDYLKMDIEYSVSYLTENDRLFKDGYRIQ